MGGRVLGLALAVFSFCSSKVVSIYGYFWGVGVEEIVISYRLELLVLVLVFCIK